MKSMFIVVYGIAVMTTKTAVIRNTVGLNNVDTYKLTVLKEMKLPSKL